MYIKFQSDTYQLLRKMNNNKKYKETNNNTNRGIDMNIGINVFVYCNTN